MEAWTTGLFSINKKMREGVGARSCFFAALKRELGLWEQQQIRGRIPNEVHWDHPEQRLARKKAFVHLSATHSFILFLQRFCRPVHIQCSMGVKHVWRKSSGIIFSQAKNELGKILTGHYRETVEKSSMLYNKIDMMLLSFEYLEHM